MHCTFISVLIILKSVTMFIFKTTRDMRYSSNFLNGLWTRVNTISPIPKETFKHYKTNKLNKKEKKQTNKTRKKIKHKMKKGEK